MTKTTKIASVAAASSSLEDRFSAMEKVMGQLADAVVKLSANAAVTPAAPAAPAAPATEPALPVLSKQEVAKLSPSEKVRYMNLCRQAYFGKSGGGTPGGVYGMVTGFVFSQAADIRTAGTHALNVYAMKRREYLDMAGE